jgi:uncharacterized protein with ParB-like and HNH nuclease domain
MSFESRSVRDIISDEINRTIFLPSIQREFVWDTSAIEKLFDSIMGDYPISSFLFWKIKEENIKDWDSYEFIRDFDKDSPHNREANVSGIHRDIYLVLDGQQRLTSLYIGLKGSYRFFYYSWKKTRLYFNLLKPPVKNEENPEELTYQFQFRENVKTKNPTTEFWYEVGRILDFEDPEDAKKDLRNQLVLFTEEQKENALKLVGRLHARIFISKLINFYEEKSQDYDKVVEIFIRANTAGKKLDYSDILLSTATAKWKKLNAREEIQNFTDEINKIGIEYEFDKDFVLKGCLYLTETLPIQYKVKTFSKPNLELIEDNWEIIKTNIETTIRLVSKYGFSNKNIVATAALLPVAFYLMKNNRKNFVASSHTDDAENQKIIQKWLIFSLVKNAFGSSSDTTLKNVRDELLAQQSLTKFPAESLYRVLNIEPAFSSTELDNIMNFQYKTKYSYLVLSLLYPGRDWKDCVFHEDHIFPQTEFQTKKLKARGFDQQRIAEYQKHYNTILNLELLVDSENLEKSSTDFSEWIKTRDENFKDRHTIPRLESYSFDDFPRFIEERRKLIIAKLQNLAV